MINTYKNKFQRQLLFELQFNVEKCYSVVNKCEWKLEEAIKNALPLDIKVIFVKYQRNHNERGNT